MSGAQHGTNVTAHAGRVSTLNAIEETRREASRRQARTERQQARQHTLILLLAGLVLALGGACAWIVTSGANVQVKLVRLDSQGHEHLLEDAPHAPLKPEQTVIVEVLQTWVEHVRWVSNDRRLFIRYWERAEHFTTQAALRQLQEFRAEQDRRQFEGRRVQVSVTQIAPVARQSLSYTVAWREEAYDLLGQLLPLESGLWTATLAVADFQGKAAREAFSLLRKKRVYRNLFGVFVDGVQWSARPLPQGRDS